MQGPYARYSSSLSQSTSACHSQSPSTAHLQPDSGPSPPSSTVERSGPHDASPPAMLVRVPTRAGYESRPVMGTPGDWMQPHPPCPVTRVPPASPQPSRPPSFGHVAVDCTSGSPKRPLSVFPPVLMCSFANPHSPDKKLSLQNVNCIQSPLVRDKGRGTP